MRKGLGHLPVAMLLLSACGRAQADSIPIETGTPCAFCRMTIMDTHLAAELIAPGEDPREYDDIGCLLNDLRRQSPSAASVAFVADYRDGALIVANDAVYTRLPGLETPMGSHLVAHREDTSRLADGRVRDGQRLTARDLFGPAGAPGGSHAR